MSAAALAAMAWAIWVAAALPAALAHGEFHGGRFAHDDFHHGRRFFAGGPFYDDYYYDYGSDCWQSERVHTPAGLRWRNVWTCSYWLIRCGGAAVAPLSPIKNQFRIFAERTADGPSPVRGFSCSQ